MKYEVDQVGKYKLLEDFTEQNMNRINIIPKGTIIEITQVDPFNKKVIGPQLYDWVNWEMPAFPLIAVLD